RESPTRAGALLRLARAQETAGETDAALRTYQQLSTIDEVWIGDAPASLVAAYVRCRLFEAHDRPRELIAEATRLRADLAAGRWPAGRERAWRRVLDYDAVGVRRERTGRTADIRADRSALAHQRQERRRRRAIRRILQPTPAAHRGICVARRDGPRGRRRNGP